MYLLILFFILFLNRLISDLEAPAASIHFFFLFLFFFFFFFFFGYHIAYGVTEPGIRSEPQLQPKLQLWQRQILNPLCWDP